MKKSLLILTILMGASTLTFAQTNPNLQLDTISIRGKSIRDYTLALPAIKFDSVVVELYLSGNRLAIIPGNFRSYIDEKLIEETDMNTESYGENKVLLRIQMFVAAEPRKKIVELLHLSASRIPFNQF